MGRNLFSLPEDSARLRMLVYYLKVHRVRLVACLVDFDFIRLSHFLRAPLFGRTSYFESRV